MLIAIIAGTIAAIITAYLVAIWLERLSQPHWPDTQDDPRAIDILNQICPWPTEGECRSRESMRGVGTRRGPGTTQTTDGTIARFHERGDSA